MAPSDLMERSTSTDQVFNALYDQIVSLQLLPGTKISETDVAKTFGYSRQPVREAFTRLANLNLLLIRPQRATLVRPFSRSIISNARFIRLAVELEVVRHAAARPKASIEKLFEANIKAQRQAITTGDAGTFHKLDYDFHQLICAAADQPAAFKTISENKAQVDRLCVLSLTSGATMDALFADHLAILEATTVQDPARAEDVLRQHLSRLDPVIDAIYTTHGAYFED